jgi:hypothetical protein
VERSSATERQTWRLTPWVDWWRHSDVGIVALRAAGEQGTADFRIAGLAVDQIMAVQPRIAAAGASVVRTKLAPSPIVARSLRLR